MSTTKVEARITHVTVFSNKKFEEVRAALEAQIPMFNPSMLEKVSKGEILEALSELHVAPPLSIFSSRDHGSLLQTVNLHRKAIQYEIGNALTASKMTRHHVSAGLYAPVRVLLRQDEEGKVAFEYDSPITTFGQFRDADIDHVASRLDRNIEAALVKAAGAQEPCE